MYVKVHIWGILNNFSICTKSLGFLLYVSTDSKKGHFSTLSIINIFLWKFYGSILGLVELILLILLTQGPIHEIFTKKYWELTELKNDLFLSRPFWFFFSKKKNFFCLIPMKISHKLCVRMDGTQFSILWWFTAKNKGGNHKWAWV